MRRDFIIAVIVVFTGEMTPFSRLLFPQPPYPERVTIPEKLFFMSTKN